MVRFNSDGSVDVLKTYVQDKEGRFIGVAVDGKIYQDGLEQNPNKEEISFKPQRLWRRTLVCYRLEPNSKELIEIGCPYELREKGRFHAVVLDEKDTPKFALLCKVDVDSETGIFSLNQTPFDSKGNEYIDRDLLKKWIIFDEYYF